MTSNSSLWCGVFGVLLTRENTFMKKLFWYSLSALLLFMQFACLKVSDVAGDWVIYNWSTSASDPAIVNTAKIRIDPVENTAFFIEVPPNDWSYVAGDVVFSELGGDSRGNLLGLTNLRYLPIDPMNEEFVTLTASSDRSVLEAWWRPPNEQEKILIMTLLRLD